MRPEFTPEFIERFWSKVDRSGGPDACWPFLGSRVKKGYGQISCSGVLLYTHRVAFELSGQKLESGMCARHYVCDNPPCCNPDHLRPGTDKDNAEDRQSHGRGRKTYDPETYLRGKGNHPGAKLSDEEVRAIRVARSQGVFLKTLASQYGCTVSTISNVAIGNVYKHVE